MAKKFKLYGAADAGQSERDQRAYTFTRLTVKPRNVTLLMVSLPVGMPSLRWRV